jgi:hypothetical protein
MASAADFEPSEASVLKDVPAYRLASVGGSSEQAVQNAGG